MSLYQLHHIETPRLIIRPVQLGDEFALHQAIERSRSALQRWMPWASDVSFTATQNFIYQSLSHWQQQTAKDFPLIVIHKESHTIISVSGFNEHTDLTRPFFEIGYWIDSFYVGQGLASELVNALTRYALQELQAIRIQICIQIENIKSIAVAKRCGYVFEAKLRNICLDCHSRLPCDGWLLACMSVTSLPALEVTWITIPAAQLKQRVLDSPAMPRDILQNSEKLPTIHTQRLCLRAPRIQDIEKLYTALMASLNEVSPWFLWAKKELTRRQLQLHVNQGIDASNDVLGSEYLFFLVWDKYQENILGEVCLKIIDWAVPNLSMTYWFDTRQVGQGYAFEAAMAVIRYAFTQRDARCLQLYVSIKNKRSLHLAQRLGFKHEGTLKNYFRNFVSNEISDSEVFSMTALPPLF